MCGRAKLPDDVSQIKLDLKIDWDAIDDYKPTWNAAPTSRLPVVVTRGGARLLTLMRWGLIPQSARSWEQARKIARSTSNVRAETIDRQPDLRAAWRQRRRCLVIADGYYEWRDSDKQSFAVALANRGPMIFAGLWDLWHAPDGEAVRSFAIVTTAANRLLRPLHRRMPALLGPDHWPAWLGEIVASDYDLAALLRPYSSGGMALWPVDRRVGNVRNDDPDLFTPLVAIKPAPRRSP